MSSLTNTLFTRTHGQISMKSSLEEAAVIYLMKIMNFDIFVNQPRRYQQLLTTEHMRYVLRLKQMFQ